MTEQQLTWNERLANWLIAYRRSLLAGAILLTVIGIPIAAQLEMERSVESLYAPENPRLQQYLASRRWFGGDEFVLVAYEDDDVLSPDSLKSVRQFATKLSQIPGVVAESTQDLSRTLQPEKVTFLTRMFLRFPATRKRLLKFSENVLIDKDRRTTAVVLRLEPKDRTDAARGETIRKIRAAAAAHDPPAFVAGEPVQVHDMFEYVEDDGRTLGLASTGLLMLVILLTFRSLRWMLLPLVLVQVTLVWTRAVLVLIGVQLTMVSSILNSLITIVCVATVMHVAVNFRELVQHDDEATAFRRTIARLAGPIFWTCVTTAVGFLSLLASSVVPVRSFGMMVATGTLLILPACAALLPGGTLLWPTYSKPKTAPAERVALGGLKHVADRVGRHPLAFALVFGGLLCGGLAGLTRLQVETDFSRNFRDSSSIVQALEFMESRLGGAGNWEVNFAAPESLTPEYLAQVRTLAEDLRELRGETGLTKVVALTDGLAMIPGIAARGTSGKLDVLRDYQPEFVPSLYNSDAGRMRIVLRALERQPSEEKLALIAEVQRRAREVFPDATATGLYVLLAYLIESLLADQVVTFAWAAAGITAVMTIAFRSLAIGAISLLPNLFPLALVIGGMGWLGLPINIGTAMIASVSVGLTVDSSIHYLTTYLRTRHAGSDHSSAVHVAHSEVGLALIFANVALIAGFLVLSLSHFIPLVYFGVLVSAAMLGGLIGNLILLPLCLRYLPITENATSRAS